MFKLDNFTVDQSTEDVYQRCILLSGRCDLQSAQDDEGGFVVVDTKDHTGQPLFPEQRWPMCHGYFKALVLLAPGANKVVISSCQDATCRTEFSVRYTPLLQTPPLHLAIMIAKDSPLLIDCPPSKFGGVSSTHSSLDAAIAKFRMTAYMWQALTAEDMRAKGLGRRSFRLEEEWTIDTLTSRSVWSRTMGPVPKIHLVRTNRTLAELRDADLAQQNPRARRKDDLHSIFTRALQAYGPPFESQANPVVAGLILDSHYDLDTNIILAHAALGCHSPTGLSLGMFGSHLTYAWPRFLEEVPDCLLDTTPTGDTVGNDNGECASMWEACAVGQGAFLHEVGHAFSAPHTSGIMTRGYSPDWPKAFLARTAHSASRQTQGTQPVTPATSHDCCWDVSDALRFSNFPHFWLPGDTPRPKDVPTVNVEEPSDEDGSLEDLCIVIQCDAGIARLVLTGDDGRNKEVDETASIATPAMSLRYMHSYLAKRFNTEKSLSLEVTGMNGKQTVIGNVWKMFENRSYLRVPGTDIRLLKKCVDGSTNQAESDDWSWAVMLKKRNRKGKLVSATKIDLRVGCALDGAVVYYSDGTKIPCGPRGQDGNDPHMGGHQHRKLVLPEGVEIAKVAVTRCGGYWPLAGLRMWLSNGAAMGALNVRGGGEVETLVPPPNHKIIGFYGASGRYGMCTRFGIVTAPRDATIPDSVYDMAELQNNPEDAHRDKRRRTESVRDESDSDDDMQSDEDHESACDSDTEGVGVDTGYDDGSDTEMERVYQKQGGQSLRTRGPADY